MTWGPWIDHDGKGLPVPIGVYVERDFGEVIFSSMTGRCGARHEGPVIERELPSWNLTPFHPHVIRYRIRKPDALKQLEQLARDVEPQRDLEVAQ